MKDIFVKEEDIKIKKEIGWGANGKIYEAIFDNKPVAYKKFYSQKTLLNEERQRFITLATNYEKISKNLIVPKLIVDDKEEMVGYLMKLIKGKTLNNLQNITLGEKIEILRKAKEVINKMNKEDNIIHSDLHLSNILYDGDNIFIIDFDKCIYENCDIGENCNMLTERYIDRNDINKNIDTFIFNMATYSFLNNRNIYDSREYILDKDYGIFNSFPDSKAICDKIALFKECDEYLIDTLELLKIPEQKDKRLSWIIKQEIKKQNERNVKTLAKRKNI